MDTAGEFPLKTGQENSSLPEEFGRTEEAPSEEREVLSWCVRIRVVHSD